MTTKETATPNLGRVDQPIRDSSPSSYRQNSDEIDLFDILKFLILNRALIAASLTLGVASGFTFHTVVKGKYQTIIPLSADRENSAGISDPELVAKQFNLAMNRPVIALEAAKEFEKAIPNLNDLLTAVDTNLYQMALRHTFTERKNVLAFFALGSEGQKTLLQVNLPIQTNSPVIIDAAVNAANVVAESYNQGTISQKRIAAEMAYRELISARTVMDNSQQAKVQSLNRELVQIMTRTAQLAETSRQKLGLSASAGSAFQLQQSERAATVSNVEELSSSLQNLIANSLRIHAAAKIEGKLTETEASKIEKQLSDYAVRAQEIVSESKPLLQTIATLDTAIATAAEKKSMPVDAETELLPNFKLDQAVRETILSNGIEVPTRGIAMFLAGGGLLGLIVGLTLGGVNLLIRKYKEGLIA